MQVLSTVEAVVENPYPLLYAQQKKLRNARAQILREEGVSYQEMMAELYEIDGRSCRVSGVVACSCYLPGGTPVKRQWSLALNRWCGTWWKMA